MQSRLRRMRKEMTSRTTARRLEVSRCHGSEYAGELGRHKRSSGHIQVKVIPIGLFNLFVLASEIEKRPHVLCGVAETAAQLFHVRKSGIDLLKGLEGNGDHGG